MDGFPGDLNGTDLRDFVLIDRNSLANWRELVRGREMATSRTLGQIWNPLTGPACVRDLIQNGSKQMLRRAGAKFDGSRASRDILPIS
jgi:hypothetical protein